MMRDLVPALVAIVLPVRHHQMVRHIPNVREAVAYNTKLLQKSRNVSAETSASVRRSMAPIEGLLAEMGVKSDGDS